MSMAWEPDRRSNSFFSPPAHLCAVTYMTEISLIVTLNKYSLTHTLMNNKMSLFNTISITTNSSEEKKEGTQPSSVTNAYIPTENLQSERHHKNAKRKL